MPDQPFVKPPAAPRPPVSDRDASDIDLSEFFSSEHFASETDAADTDLSELFESELFASDPDASEFDLPETDAPDSPASAPVVPVKRGSTRRRRRPVFYILIIALAVLAAVSIFLISRFRLFDSLLVPRNSKSVDLRLEAISAEQYNEMSALYDDTEIRWSIPLSVGAADSFSTELDMSDLQEEDIALLPYFTRLKTLTLGNGFDSFVLLDAIHAAIPSVEVLYSVPVGSRRISCTETELAFGDEASVDGLVAALPYLPNVTDVDLTKYPITPAEATRLTGEFPGIRFLWYGTVCGERYRSDVERISFIDRTLTGAEVLSIAETMPLFPALQTIECTGACDDEEALLELASRIEPDVVFELRVYGRTVSTLTEELDFSNHIISDGAAEIERVIPAMHHLAKVVLCDCGIGDEDMDALDKKYENVRFVWMVHFGNYYMRTDETAFIAARFQNAGYLFDWDTEPLKYCHDLIALDFGHQRFSDCSFLYEMPHIRFLILAEGEVDDITPVGSLKELEYFEMFQTKVTDLSPLLECKNLLDLNICYIPYAAAPSAMETLLQMPWLERIFYFGNPWTQAERDQLRDAFPDAEVVLYDGLESTGLDWRYHERYYEMRDLLEYYYMPGGTNG